MNTKRGTVVVSIIFLSGCQKKPMLTHNCIALRPSSATEAFDLESKCAALGQKILEDRPNGPAFTQEEFSHLNLADNRCYVRLQDHISDLTIPEDKIIQDDVLIDGQTGETLASVSVKGTQRTAYVFDASLRKLGRDSIQSIPSEVTSMIDKMMYVDRHP